MATMISIPDKLILKISHAAAKEGFDKPQKFVARILEEKLLELEDKQKIFEITERVRTALEEKGLSEEATLADFERFRERLLCE